MFIVASWRRVTIRSESRVELAVIFRIEGRLLFRIEGRLLFRIEGTLLFRTEGRLVPHLGLPEDRAAVAAVQAQVRPNDCATTGKA